MKSLKITISAALSALALSLPALAEDVNFVPPTALTWHDSSQWDPFGIPVDGDSVDTEEGNITFQMDIHNAASPGSGVNLPNSTLTIGRGNYFDSVGDDDGITADSIGFNGAGGQAPTINVPVTANTLTSNRHGAVFNDVTTIGTINSQGSHQQKWQFNAAPTGPITSIRIADTDSRGNNHDDNFFVNADMETVSLDLEWGRVNVSTGSTFTVSDLQITDDADWTVKNEIQLADGDMVANTLTIENIALDNSVTLNQQAAGTYGSIGTTTADFPVSWITGNGILTVGAGSGGGGSAFNTWAGSNGVPADSEAVDSDSGGQNNLYEFGLGGNPTDGNDDGALLHAFSAEVDGGSTGPEGVLTILVREGASFSPSTNDQVSAEVDGIVYTVSADTTPEVASGVAVSVSGTVVDAGLPAAPGGYEYASFYITGSEGYFQVTVEQAP